MKKVFLTLIFLTAVLIVNAQSSISRLADSSATKVFSLVENKDKYSQEIIGIGTNQSQDGYITAGFFIGRWGLYAGIPYNEAKIISSATGTVSQKTRFGVLRMVQPGKWFCAAGLQPGLDGTKPHFMVGYNPLKSNDMKLWLIGNVTGSVATAGAGLSYRIK